MASDEESTSCRNNDKLCGHVKVEEPAEVSCVGMFLSSSMCFFSSLCCCLFLVCSCILSFISVLGDVSIIALLFVVDAAMCSHCVNSHAVNLKMICNCLSSS